MSQHRNQTRLANYPDESLDGFAEVIAAQLRNGADVEAAAGLATRAFTRFPDEALTESFDELAMLARRMPPIQGVDSFVRQQFTNQRFLSDPIGITHTARHLRAANDIDINNIRAFEQSTRATNPNVQLLAGSLDRRIDVVVDLPPPTNFEFKGSLRNGAQAFRFAGNSEVQFLNDVLIQGQTGTPFRWVLPPQIPDARIDETIQRMRRLLGADGGQRDPRLEETLRNLADDSIRENVETAIERIIDQLDAGEIVERAAYPAINAAS